MKHTFYILTILSLFLLSTCDILRFSLFEVISWSPGNGYHSESENIIVSLDFSKEPDKASVESNFSLTGNGNRIKGNFSWQNNKFIFTPIIPLEKNIDYNLDLAPGARSINGHSIEESFNKKFTTKAETERPVIISCYPSLYEEIDDLKTNIRLEFSLPVSLNTLYENVSFKPSINGIWSLKNEEKLAIFTPSEKWTHNNRYEIYISSSLTDYHGNNLRNNFTSIFITGTNRELPYLVNAFRITKDDEYIQLISDKGFSSITEQPVENSGWEKDDKLSLVFSKPVSASTVKNNLNAENGQNLIMQNSLLDYGTEIIFKFERIPIYESRFIFRLKAGVKDIFENETKDESIFKIVANGAYSKPPELVGIRIPLSPNNENNYNPVFFSADSAYEIIEIEDDNYPIDEIVPSWIEFYFSTAENAVIDIFSFMELFRLDTSNNVIVLYPRHVKTNNFSITKPQAGYENYQRVEMIVNIKNEKYFGIINFQIASGLKDSFGNQNDKKFIISLIK